MKPFPAPSGRPVRARIRRNHTTYLAGIGHRADGPDVVEVKHRRVARLVKVLRFVPGPVTLFPATVLVADPLVF